MDKPGTKILPDDYATSPLGQKTPPAKYELPEIAEQLRFFITKPDYLQLATTQDLVHFFQTTHKRILELNQDWENDIEEYDQENAPRPSDKKEIQDLQQKLEESQATLLQTLQDHAATQQQLDDEKLNCKEDKVGLRRDIRELRAQLEWHDERWSDASAAINRAIEVTVPDDEAIARDLVQQLLDIRKAIDEGEIRVMTQILGFLPDAGAPLIPQLWSKIPAALKGTHPEPADAATFNAFFEGLTIGCPHPEELAQTLGDPDAQEWTLSLRHVERLMTAAAAAPAATTTVATTKLFDAKDVPTLKNPDEYFPYRTRLEAFFRGTQTPSPADFSTALYRVLATLDHPTVAAAVIGWDPTPQVRATWVATWRAFLLALDDKFLPKTILPDTIREYMRCHPTKEESAVSFFNRFEAALTKRQAVERLKGAPVVSDDAVVSRLLAILPRELVDAVEVNHMQQGIVTQSRTPRQLRDDFEIVWRHRSPPKADKPTGPARGRNAPPRLPANSTDALKPRRCGLVCNYETAPRVPDHLRGSLFNDDADSRRCRAEAARLGLCQYCRRPASQHATVGATPRLVTPANAPARGRAAPARLPSPPPGPRVEDITDQQAIEDAPSSA